MADDAVEAGATRLPILDSVDVLVCGGGVAGIAAAVAAARAGARTLLLERAGFLGGTATGAMMALIVIPFDDLAGFPREFFQRLSADHGAHRGGRVVPWDTEAYKLTSLEMVLESGAEVLLYTWISDAIVIDGRVAGVVVENKSGRQAVLAKVTIDASGDGDVAARAGVACVVGREADAAMRPATVMGHFGNIDLRRLKAWIDANPSDVVGDPGRNVFDLDSGIIRVDGFFSVVERARKTGLLEPGMPINYLRFSGLVRPENIESGDLICNSTRIYGVDGTNARDVTRAEIEGRRQLQAVLATVRAMLPGFERCTLIGTSSYLGVRETRRIRGRQTLTYEDLQARRRFPDSLAVLASLDYGSAEIHGPDQGSEGSAADRWVKDMVLGMTRFEFPAGCMVTDTPGLLVAGRCVSVTHEVDKFTRNMGPAALMGQASGVLATMISRHSNAGWNDLPIGATQRHLVASGLQIHLDNAPDHAKSNPASEETIDADT
jgi:hypothetical protein